MNYRNGAFVDCRGKRTAGFLIDYANGMSKKYIYHDVIRTVKFLI